MTGDRDVWDDGAPMGRGGSSETGTVGAARASALVALFVAVAAIVGVLVWTSVDRSDELSGVARFLRSEVDASPVGLVGVDLEGVPGDRATVAVTDLQVLTERRVAWLVVADPDPGDADPALLELIRSAGEVAAADHGEAVLYHLDDAALDLAQAAVDAGAPDEGGPTTTAAPTTTIAPTTTTQAPGTTTTTVAPSEPPASEPGTSAEEPGDPGAAAGHVVVAAGDTFWSIARDQVAAQVGGVPTDTQVTTYWAQLVNANAGALAQPGNPNLILPGQVLVLP